MWLILKIDMYVCVFIQLAGSWINFPVCKQCKTLMGEVIQLVIASFTFVKTFSGFGRLWSAKYFYQWNRFFLYLMLRKSCQGFFHQNCFRYKKSAEVFPTNVLCYIVQTLLIVLLGYLSHKHWCIIMTYLVVTCIELE